MKVAEAASRYMDDKRGRLRACTLAGYESALALHVLPRWGELELEAITPEDVQGWIDSFELPGAAEKSYKTLRQVIRWAIRRLGVRMYDPTAAGVELPHKPAHRPRTMEASQVRAYLRALWGHECEAVAICSVTLGLRRGEACGLKWSDIDLRTGEVRIRRSRQVVRGNEVIEAPKSLGLPGIWKSYRWSLTTKVGSVLDVKSGRVDVNGAELQIYTYNNSDAQKWHIYAEGPGRVTLWIRTA